MVAVLTAVAALIVPQQGIHGVDLAMSHSAVTNRLGPVVSARLVKGSPVPEQLWVFLGYRVWFASGLNVVQIETTSRVDHTASGIGVGSTEADLRAGVKGVRCATDGGIRHCHLGTYSAGHVVTDFFLQRGRVDRVVIGRVLD